MGSGNNWAYGFNEHGPGCIEEVIEKLDWLLEKIDYLYGVMLL